MPEGTESSALDKIMEDINRACLEENVSLTGGHTEVTSVVSQPVIIVTVLGKTKCKRFLKSSSAKPGDTLIMTKWAGMEGTAILAKDYGDVLEPLLGKEEIKEASSLFNQISVTRDGMIALENMASACHDATEGGILGAV